MKKIKWNNTEEYEIAMTQWIIRHLRANDIKETHFSREAGLGKNETDARTFRKIKEGKRHWSIVDLCKLAEYFGEKPSAILAKIETYYETEGINLPGKTAEQIISLGLSRENKSTTLISSWKKKGKSFIFENCDPDWKKIAKGEISRIIGRTAKEIFPDYSEIIASFERAMKTRGGDTIEIWYKIKSSLEKRLLDSESNAEKRLLSVHSVFVPPDGIVVYVEDITDKEGGVRQL
ncbi:hypothetical protein KKA14_03400 [bacterium]|nr:hypothetical protein [bacterium]